MEFEQLERRDVILDAALAEFNARGVGGGSIQGIRRRSGASVGSIYHHFGTKAQLAAVVYVEGLRRYQRGFLETLERSTTAREGVERVVRHHGEWIESSRELARFLFVVGDSSAPTAGKALRRTNREFFAAVEQWTRPRVERGELRELEPELLTALWIGASQEHARHWLAGRVQISPTTAAPVLADAAWRCLCP